MPAFSFDPRAFHWYRPGGGGGVFRPDGFPRLIGEFDPALHGRYERQQERGGGRVVVRVRGGWRLHSAAEGAAVGAREGLLLEPAARWFWVGPGWVESARARRAADCVQVVVWNQPRVASERFSAQVVELAEGLARELRLDEIVVQLQRNGVEEGVLGVTP